MATPFQSFPASLLVLSPRITLTSDPATSVAGINTYDVGDGALVYCVESTTTFRLDKADSTTPPDGTTVIEPSAGPGRWKVLSSGGGGSVSPFTRLFYVDSGTAVAPADQDGSVSNPFSTVQAAIDVIAALTPAVGSIQFGGNLPVPGNFAIPAGAYVLMFGTAVLTGNCTIGNGGVLAMFNQATMSGTITAGDSCQTFFDPNSGTSGTITAGDGYQHLSVSGMNSGLVTVGDDCNLRYTDAAPVAGVTCTGTGGTLIISCGANRAVGSAVTQVAYDIAGAISGTGLGVGASGCRFGQPVNCYAFDANGCQIEANITASVQALFKGCRVAGTPTIDSGVLAFSGSDFVGAATLTIGASATFDNYSWRGFLDAAGVASNKNFVTVRGIRRAQYSSLSTDIDPGVNIDLVAVVEDNLCHLVGGTPSLIEFDKAGTYLVSANVYSAAGPGALRAYLRANPAGIDLKFADAEIASGFAACPVGTYTFAVGDRLALFGQSTGLNAYAGLTIQLME